MHLNSFSSCYASRRRFLMYLRTYPKTNCSWNLKTSALAFKLISHLWCHLYGFYALKCTEMIVLYISCIEIYTET